MSYISQIIVFILAIMGILFKSVKVDANGNTVLSASGLPRLTKSGKIVAALLIVSFVISLLSTYSSNKSSDEAKERLKIISAQLKESTNTIASLKDPLTTVEVFSLWVEVPLNHPLMAKYQARLETSLQNSMSRDDVGRVFAGEIHAVLIGFDSPLMPNEETEPVAYAVLRNVSLEILLYGEPQTVDQLKNSSQPADVRIPIRTGGWGTKVKESPDDPGLFLAYDLKTHRAFLHISNLKFSPRSIAKDQHYWSKAAGGRIHGIPDLPGTQVVISISSFEPLIMVTPNNDNSLNKQAIDFIRSQMRLAELNLVLSEHQAHLVYIGDRAFKNQRLFNNSYIMNMEHFDNKGIPFYICTLPESLDELLGTSSANGETTSKNQGK